MKLTGNLIIRAALVALLFGMMLAGCQKITIISSGRDTDTDRKDINDPAVIEVKTKQVEITED